jgi:hypothetical protein
MKKDGAITKKEKAEKAKKKFLKELTESVDESNLASKGEVRLSTLEESLRRIENTHGGRRAGAGRKPKPVKKTTHGVKLTTQEFQAIIKKYGTFAKGVKSLIKKESVTA